MHGKVEKILIEPMIGVVPITLSSDTLCSYDTQHTLGQRGLKLLRLFGNNITDVQAGTFDFGQALELLDLAHNRYTSQSINQ